MAHAVEVLLLINKDDEEEENVNLLETVLVPTDFSRKSLEALNIIRTLREFVGKVLFVHVIEHSLISTIIRKSMAVQCCF